MSCRAVIAATGVFRKKYKREDRDYQYWKEGSHPQLIENERGLWQKLEYIHLNPVK